MNVLYTNHTAEVSGAERSLLTLLEGPPAGVRPRAAVPRGKLASLVDQLGVPTDAIVSTSGSLRMHPLHTPRALAEMSIAAIQLRRIAARHRADIVHANSVRAGLELALSGPSRAARLVHVRDCLPPSPVTSATFRLIARTSSAVVANSHYTAATVRAHAPGAHVEVVHPVIDPARFDPRRIDRAAARASLAGASTHRFLLGVVAQLSPWKGQDTAIATLRALCEQGVDAHLVLVGSAKFIARSTRFDNAAYVAQLQRAIADWGLTDRVSLLGERDDIPELVRALDVLLLPSHEEPFGRALLEAMALEVPVVATDVGGPRELVRDGREGYLVPPREPAAWARAVLRVLEDDEHRHELGRAGRERIEQAFTLEHQAQAMLAVYERALRQPAGGSVAGAP